MEISMLPIHALSIRACATMFPPSSTTATFMGWPISLAFFSAALITRRASSNFTAVMASPYWYALSIGIIGSRLSLQLARLSLRLLPGEKAFHANVRNDVSAFVNHRDVHGLANFPGFLLRRADYAAGIF